MGEPLDTAALIRAAEEAGFDLGDRKKAERRIEDYRYRRLLPRQIRAGQQGRRSIWLYPIGTDRQFIALLRWRKKTHNNLEAVRVALWAEGFPIPLDDARRSIRHVLRGFEMALNSEFARFTPDGVDPAALVDHPEALQVALERWADELARMRSRFPIPRDLSARMTLEQRRRAMTYWLAFTVGLIPEAEDAVFLEQLFGISRGRTSSAAAILPGPPEETFPTWMAHHPRTLQTAVENAHDATLRLVQTSLQTFLTLFPLIMPVLLPTDSNTAQLVEQMFSFLDAMPPESVALFAAVQIANIERKQPDIERLEQHTHALKPAAVLREIAPTLTPDQRRQIRDRQTKRMAK